MTPAKTILNFLSLQMLLEEEEEEEEMVAEVAAHRVRASLLQGSQKRGALSSAQSASKNGGVRVSKKVCICVFASSRVLACACLSACDFEQVHVPGGISEDR